MAARKPESPAEPRGDEPYYIDDRCHKCGAELVQDPDAVEDGWHDEWVCPECQDGVYMDWPNSEFFKIGLHR